MSEKLLSFAALVLLLASFSFRTEDRFTTNVQLDDVLLVTRVIPIAAVAAMCILATPVRQYYNLVRELLSPPFLFWNWYAGVAAVSGISSNLSPLWAAWKCGEIVVVALWGATLMVHIRYQRSTRVLEGAFRWLVVGCILVCLFAATEFVRLGHSPREFVSQGARLQLEVPHLNSITLSIIALFAICGSLLDRSRVGLITRLVLLLPIFAVFAFARSRTGVLGLAILGGFAFVNSTLAPARKLMVMLILVSVVTVLAMSPSVREWMRLSSWDEVLRGAGRIRTADNRGSGWSESLRLVRDRPAIGYGFTIVRRFMNKEHTSVDNFALQALIAAGVLGGTPMICYSLWTWLRWLLKVFTPDDRYRYLAEMGMTSTCLGVAKSVTTNGYSAYDVSLILFLLGAIALQVVRRPIHVVPIAPAMAPA